MEFGYILGVNTFISLIYDIHPPPPQQTCSTTLVIMMYILRGITQVLSIYNLCLKKFSPKETRYLGKKPYNKTRLLVERLFQDET